MEARNSMQEERELLTSQEAKDAFIQAGLSEATFHRRVGAGQIESILPEGRKRGALYPKDQVLAAIGGAKPKKTISHLQPTIFSKATVQDMPGIAELLKTFFSKINIEKRIAWMERNPDIGYILRCEGKIVGCAFIMPMTEEKILQILDSQVKPPTKPDEITLFEPGKPLYIYGRSVGVLQATSKEQRRHWAARLISGLINEIIKLGARGIVIKKIYAQTDTKRMESTLKKLGFMQIASIAGNRNFVLDIAASGSSPAMRYKRALNMWRAQNEEE
jgi:hypothetical protein